MSIVADAVNWLCTPKGNSVTGLALDLIGITILFIFQVDRNHALRKDGAEYLVTGGKDENESQKWNLYRKLTVLGFLLLITGFALQLTGTLRS